MRSYQPRISISARQSKEVESDPIISIVIFHKNDGDLGGLEINGKVCEPFCHCEIRSLASLF
jgi:hypothetical protein